MGNTADNVRFGLTGGDFRTELLGSHQLTLEGCSGVLDLSASLVGFRCGRQQVWVRGQNLRVTRVDAESAVLSGRIEAVEFK